MCVCDKDNVAIVDVFSLNMITNAIHDNRTLTKEDNEGIS